MKTDLLYMPTFRVRQQENLVLSSFDFGANMFPMLEIIKEFDRKRPAEKQAASDYIHCEIINNINAQKVFVDLPLYLNERASMKDEVIQFTRSVIFDMEKRTAFLESLSPTAGKTIPVVSSYLYRTGEANSIAFQVNRLRPIFGAIAFRILYSQFAENWEAIMEATTDSDYIILDLDILPPYPSPSIRQIVNKWQTFERGVKIVLRSSINTDIFNVNLEHNEIVFLADNGLTDQYKSTFKADAFGDYSGIKKDDLTSGGAISPGFLFYNAVDNQFYGFKGNGGKGEAKYLSDFEEVIVPSVINSDAAQQMQNSGRPYLDQENWGWVTLTKIRDKVENGKSQAKFKRIALEHYLHCIKTKIKSGDLD